MSLAWELFAILCATIIIFAIAPMIIASKKINRLRKIGQLNAGSRGVDELLQSIVHHEDELIKAKAELTQLININIDTPENLITKPISPSETLIPVKIIFNSDEIACKYKGKELPKYLQDENNRWFIFEGLAEWDSNHNAMVDDEKKDYVTIHDAEINHSFFYKHIDSKPSLIKENDINLIESL